MHDDQACTEGHGRIWIDKAFLIVMSCGRRRGNSGRICFLKAVPALGSFSFPFLRVLIVSNTRSLTEDHFYTESLILSEAGTHNTARVIVLVLHATPSTHRATLATGSNKITNGELKSSEYIG